MSDLAAPRQAVQATAAPALAPQYRLSVGLPRGAVAVLIGLTQGFGIYLVQNNQPGIQGALGATATETAWLTTAYFATALSASALVTKMRLQYGLREFAEWGIFAYLIVSALNLLISTWSSAVAARLALGFAATPLTSLALQYMLEAFPKRLAPYALTLGFATLQFGAPLSRIVSEALLQNASWRGLQALDLALACASLAAIASVRLTPVPRLKVINEGDALSFGIFATSLALLCVALTQGRAAWWTDAPWIGLCLAGGLACFGLLVVIELGRPLPLIDFRRAAHPTMLSLALSIIVFRIALSEQPFGVVSMMYSLGIYNEEMHGLFWHVALGTGLGFALAMALIPTRMPRLPALVALVFIGIAAYLDSLSTSATRPENLYFSQTLLAAGTAMFLASSLLTGLLPIVAFGKGNIVSFSALFGACQNLGSLIGLALLTTLLQVRTSAHLAALAPTVTLTDPLVVSRISQQASAIGGSLVDSAQRQGQAVAQLALRVTREATVFAYDDIFQLLAFAAGIGFLILVPLSIRFDLQAKEAALALLASKGASAPQP